MDLTVDKRDRLVELLASEYTVPEQYIDCVKVAIKQYATKNYSDKTISSMAKTPQSLSKGLALLRERSGKTDLSLFRGIISEWLVCAEYNALKNKGAVVITITNPDPSSKADLLHIIDTSNGFKAVPGPDVKSGGSSYVFNQWKKIVQNRYEIPMVDVDDILTTEEGLKQLTKKQRAEFEELSIQFPNKRPIPSAWNKDDIMRVIADYLKYVEFDLLPSTESALSIKDISVPRIKDKLYSGKISNAQSYDWTVFLSEVKTIFNTQESSKDVDTVEFGIQSDSGNSISSHSQKANIVTHKSKSLKLVDKAKSFFNTGLNTVLNSGKGAVKWLANHPEERTAIVAAVGEIIAEVAINNSNRSNSEYIGGYDDKNYKPTYYQYDNSEDTILTNSEEVKNVPESSSSHHDYPEQRKSPRVHIAHRDGKPYLRGGTAEEKQQFREENDLDF
ncbi:Uncharacterised protein [Streptococcus criceti]|uniref:Uncharacterized protein n=1 Tax=Streptococcus criceti HS-6 TaxID=873449 RepID=G5JP09_STRCG|nr:hypothetical protein [Streptococcus criceti]EHI74097.1 hypothetical protein STRCR_1540 [Streptococcus criceti HS-6]SUN43419.1 Uncharacterised protein [Streptococcus criceti]